MNPVAAGAIALAAGVGVYATLRAAIVKFCHEDLGDRLHYWRHADPAEQTEPYARRSRVLLGADPHGDLDVGSAAERWLKDQQPPAAEPPAN